MTNRNSAKALRVLIVEDCKDTAGSLAVLVRHWGHEPRVAHRGDEALAAAAEQLPDAVILDIGLPDMTGWELLMRLRRQPGLEKVRALVVSGYGGSDDVARSIRTGCEVHLLKPAGPEALRRLLDGREEQGDEDEA